METQQDEAFPVVLRDAVKRQAWQIDEDDDLDFNHAHKMHDSHRVSEEALVCSLFEIRDNISWAENLLLQLFTDRTRNNGNEYACTVVCIAPKHVHPSVS
eukprot:TRINITY_DN9068_c0_g1_i2.p1 TRINITY_DN9068_c0_g1~~TRINITY_DN9068_c0_g1_i2.p1  ORF type:complete len:100 (-),score=3.73 TRINITY_DN9068_c0_g1_i2:36-335(-)